MAHTPRVHPYTGAIQTNTSKRLVAKLCSFAQREMGHRPHVEQVNDTTLFPTSAQQVSTDHPSSPLRSKVALL